MGLVRNRSQVKRDIQMALTRLEEAPVALYRRVVREIFRRIVMETPQFSGRAVANWNLGINSPDMSVDYGMGDDLMPTTNGFGSAPRQKGDMKWASEALQRMEAQLRKVRRGDKVFITNAVRGDDARRNESGSLRSARSHEFPYLAAIQAPGKWYDRLREVNRPYETAMESAIFVVEQYLATGEMPIGDLEAV